MTEPFNRICSEMLIELSDTWQLNLPEHKKVEAAFHISNDHWNKVKAYCADNPFDSEENEIDFFRNIKPRFTCFIAYYTILYVAVLFAPKDDIELLQFLQSESERLKRFSARNSAFINYYESGANDKDREYFLHSNMDVKNIQFIKHVDQNATHAGVGDQLISAYLSEKMYYDFIKDKLMKFRARNAE